MRVHVSFFSYFKDLTDCSEAWEDLPEGATIAVLLAQLHTRFPKIIPLQNSTLIAVGLDYQPKTHVLKPDDHVSLFPPVQGG